MGNIILAIVSSLLGVFLTLAFKKKKNFPGLSENFGTNPGAVSENYSKNTSSYPQNGHIFLDVNESDSNVLKKIGYFLGVANDEKNSDQYSPTPIQDTDPEELA